MPSDPTKYRRILYIGGRYLEPTELNKQQEISLLADKQGVGALFRTGATLNVTLTVDGSDVVLTHTNVSLPMLVFLNGTFEPFTVGTLSYSPGKTSGSDYVYLNYEIHRITSADDPTLIDPASEEDTAEMGELRITVSADDTSSVPLDEDTQLEKNTTPLVLFTLTRGEGGSITPVYTDNGIPQAQATDHNSGLVKLTTGTAAGVAVATNDPRMTDARAPLDNTVTTAKVKALIQNGTNSDESPRYDPATSNQGGVTSDKLIYSTLKNSITWVLDYILALISSGQAGLIGHIGAALGGSVHPMPTPQQVGAAPVSHVGLNLGRADSHPAVVQSDTAGFETVRPGVTVGQPSDWAYRVREGATTLAGATHDGDLFSILANAFVASPSGSNLKTGTVGKMSSLAQVLIEHVNQYPHKNPHGLVAGDLGAATVTYADAQDASTLASAKSYTDAHQIQIAARTETVDGFNVTGKYLIVRLGSLEVGIGMGTISHGQVIPIPAGWPVQNAIVNLALHGANTGEIKDYSALRVISCTVDTGRVANIWWMTEGGSIQQDVTLDSTSGFTGHRMSALWHGLVWRNI